MNNRRVIVTSLLLAMSAAYSFAQGTNPAKAAKAPAAKASPASGSLVPSIEKRIPKLNDFHPQQPKRIVLSNGMVIFLQEDHELPLIDGSILIRGGSRSEPAEKIGLVSLYGQAWRTSGTKTRSGDQLDDYLEARAAKVETGGGGASTSMGWSALKGDFNDVFGVVVELLREPEFREDKIALAKQQMNAGIARRNDDAGSITSREAGKLAYGADSPYARVPEFATVAAVTKQDMEAWHAKYVQPNNIIVGVVGDFDPVAMEAKLRAAFESWPKGWEAPKNPEVAIHPAKPGTYFVQKDDVNQSNVRLIELGLQRDNPDYFAATVLNEVFGGGFAGRLLKEIRTKQGLAYGAGGGIGSAYDHAGVTAIGAGTRSEATVQAITSLNKEVDRLFSEPPSVAEVNRAKDTILNTFVFEFDSKDKVLGERINYEFYGYPPDFLERYRTAVEKVTPEDVLRVAKKYIHKDQFSLLVVGNAKEFDKPLSSLGTVTPIDITIPTPPETTQPAAPTK